jgi:hypothetical protein
MSRPPADAWATAAATESGVRTAMIMSAPPDLLSIIGYRDVKTGHPHESIVSM